MTTLLVAEHDNKNLSKQTAQALSAAVQLGSDVHILVAGQGIGGVADSAAKLDGVAKVLLADAPAYAHQLAEPLADLIVKLSAGYDAILAASNSNGKNVMPRVAALLDVMQISDIVAVESADTFQRPIYAGNALQTVQSHDAKKIITVRTASFPSVEAGNSAPLETIEALTESNLSSFVSEQVAVSERPDLTGAKIIVSGGRALGTKESFEELLVPLADKLGAAIGASRAAVDLGYAPNDWQVGQTGKIVAPDLYIAVGISGAIQHLAGIKDARVIVAINKDEDAPIFDIADYGLVGDLFEILPQMLSALEK